LARDWEIPALLLGAAPENGQEAVSVSIVTPDKLAELLVEYASALDLSMEKQDTRYSLFYFRGRTLFVSERTHITALLLGSALILLILLVFSMGQRRDPADGRKSGAGYWGGIAGNTALFIGLAAFFWGLVLDITWTPALLWALFFTVMGRILRRTWGVCLCAILSPAAAVLFAVTGIAGLSETVQLHFPAVLLGILLILPVILLILRGIMLYRAG
jgi:hypothetical protein